MGWRAKITLAEGVPMAYKDFTNKLVEGTLRE